MECNINAILYTTVNVITSIYSYSFTCLKDKYYLQFSNGAVANNCVLKCLTYILYHINKVKQHLNV